MRCLRREERARRLEWRCILTRYPLASQAEMSERRLRSAEKSRARTERPEDFANVGWSLVFGKSKGELDGNEVGGMTVRAALVRAHDKEESEVEEREDEVVDLGENRLEKDGEDGGQLEAKRRGGSRGGEVGGEG